MSAVALAERGVAAGWSCAFPSRSPGISRLADDIVKALYGRIATGEIDRLDAVFCRWRPGQPVCVERRHLFPVAPTELPTPMERDAPLLDLEPAILLRALMSDDLHARLCDAALNSFAAENEARMEAMAAAHGQIERKLAGLRATERLVRQEETTAEIIELAAGEAASRARRSSALVGAGVRGERRGPTPTGWPPSGRPDWPGTGHRERVRGVLDGRTGDLAPLLGDGESISNRWDSSATGV